jgi:hypothetical protein
MKFRLYIALLFAFILMGISISCQKELNFDGQPGGTPKVCISCSYLPVCDSSVYTYIDSTAQGIDTNRSVVRLLGDSVVEGLTYNRVSTLGFFGQGVLYNCDAQTYKVYLNLVGLGFDFQDLIDSLAGGLPIPPGLITPPQQLLTTILKVNESAGATWKDIILKPTIPLINLEVAINHTLIRKDFTHQVLGKNYPNTIEIYSVIGLKGSPPIPSAEFLTLRIFYARGVGIVEGRLVTNGVPTTVRKLSRIQTF